MTLPSRRGPTQSFATRSKPASRMGAWGSRGGAAGIGKSYALELIVEEFKRGDDDVMVFTASEATGASRTKFFANAVLELAIMGHGGVEPIQRLERFLLNSFPFRGLRCP